MFPDPREKELCAWAVSGMRNVKQVDETDQSTDAEWRVMSRSSQAAWMADTSAQKTFPAGNKRGWSWFATQ
ncbi:hypothetical protein CU103_22590 [Phyllobacterium sophorae]|uniref:Uncharacterized protein n=1 Tax=Phyllobacterium sophorae TaxID=1520277 RepID=A0A2P7B553_9HYPH|nr:hypothetical protein CU103_22590 [Phyllobacterium sophorae]